MSATGSSPRCHGAEKHWQREALAGPGDLPLPCGRVRVDFAYGQTLRRAGRRREADTVSKKARGAYVTLGARAYVERRDPKLPTGGLNTGRTMPGMADLTPQKQAAARILAAGAMSEQATPELFISVKTVRHHLKHICSKLGARSRSALAAMFKSSDA